MKVLDKTSIYESHIELNAKMVEFADYLMPIHYKNGIQYEYNAVRKDVGLFDVSHMGVFKVSGSNSEQLLNKLLSNNILKLSNEKAMYTLLCNRNGGVIDDLIIYKIDNYFILIVNASNKNKNLKWIRNNIIEDVEIDDISKSTSLVAIQGPNSREKIKKILNINLEIDFYSCKKYIYHDENIFIARTGYTGELGFEILGPSNIINEIWTVMGTSGIAPIGLAVRDILRIEMGYCLYGHEIDEHINPIDAGLGWVIDEKSTFMGSKEIENINNQKNKLIFFKMSSRGIPRQGFDIYKENDKIGFVTSGTFSYTLESGVGIGFIKRNINDYSCAYLLIRDKKINIDISTRPFMSNTSLRR